jgi:alpha-glucosidase
MNVRSEMWKRRLLSAALIGGAWCSPLVAQWHSIGPLVSHHQEGISAFVLNASAGAVRCEFLADDLVRVRLAPTGVFSNGQSWAVVRAGWPPVTVTSSERSDALVLSSHALTVEVRRSPLRIRFLTPAGDVINEDDPLRGMAWAGNEVRVWKRMPQQEYYFGFGEKAGSFERRSTSMTMWNSDIPAYAADTDPLYQSIPFFYGMKNGRTYGTFLDNPAWSSFDMGKGQRDCYSFGAESGELDYYFFAGPSPTAVLTRYTELVGRMPLPPRWSLGYQQCRWSYAPEERLRTVARTFRERRIPCDVLYLDIDYMDGYRIFTWNRTSFPDPKALIGDLAREGFRVAVIVDPGIKADTAYAAFQSGRTGNHFVRYPDGRLFIGKVWPGECAFPDFTNGAAREWWGRQFAGLVADGVRGWWNDMNEPSVFGVPTKTIDLNVVHNADLGVTDHSRSHNIYGMQMTRATYDGVRALLPAERPFVLTRASYAGGHRFASAWTGDNVATWEHLAMALTMCLGLSVSGQPFVGSDIGGFIGYPSGELFARWLQLGVFTPLMRAHSVINEKNKEPWEFGTAWTDINRETISLRYRMLPYIYSVMHDASVTGLPAMRPMAFAFPSEESMLWATDQFMFGEHLLVAPVLREGATTRDVRLPLGTWYEFETGRRIDGGRQIAADAPFQRLPLYARAGAVIPMQQTVQYTGEAPIDPLTLVAFPPAPGEEPVSSLYEDDGISFAYMHGDSLSRTVTQKETRGVRTLTISGSRGTYVPPPRRIVVRFMSETAAPAAVVMNGKQSGPGSHLWAHDAGAQVTSVTIGDTREPITIEIRTGK